MRKIIRFFLLQLIGLFALISFANAAGDLTLISSSVTPTNLGLGQILTVNLSVKNNGTTYAADNHIAIYLNTAQSFTNAILLSVISLEGLAPTGQNTIQFVYPIPYNITAGTNYVLVAIDAYDVIAESNEANNNYSLATTINLSSTVVGAQNLPYPIIFVHGLVGSDERWYPFMNTLTNYYGWSFGGNMNFCLNQDANTSTSNVTTDYHDWSGSIGVADFYTVNFNTDNNGNEFVAQANSFQSNQSGVVKQGYAIRDAIKHVLQVTGRNKVILVGHSMGGLASREYIQNSNVWQTDGQHHVAKLFTIGTPHGGSDQTFAGLENPFGSIDESSEAVRDLRTDYASGYNGTYLFGGNEDPTQTTGLVSNYFCNVDVNCDGGIYDNIIGLNQKYLPTEISYSCVIGDGQILNSDGVVTTYSANLNNFPGSGSVYADTFLLVHPITGTTLWHSDLTNQNFGCVQGLDEANEYNQAYEVTSNQLYFGLITKQSLSPLAYTPDYDDYKINVANGNLNIKVYNMPIPQERIDVLNSSHNIVYTGYSNGRSSYELNTNLAAGQYYIEFWGTPVDGDGSWYCPYAFKLSGSFTTDVEEIKTENYFNTFNYPNPFNSTTTIAFTLPQTDIGSIKVYDLMGRLISTLVNGQMQEGEHRIDFDGSALASGIYTYVIQSGNNIAMHKLNIVK